MTVRPKPVREDKPLRQHTSDMQELAEWRAGKRRVVWRVVKPERVREFPTKRAAWEWWATGFQFFSGTTSSNWALGVYRVTVRPRRCSDGE